MKRVITIAALAALVSTPAFAHAHLIQATPADKAVVASAPTQLLLKFSESLQLKFTGVIVTGPDKKTVKLGGESVDPKTDTILTVPLEGTLAAGVYTVAWHALSTDGHKTQGTYTFTVKG